MHRNCYWSLSDNLDWETENLLTSCVTLYKSNFDVSTWILQGSEPEHNIFKGICDPWGLEGMKHKETKQKGRENQYQVELSVNHCTKWLLAWPPSTFWESLHEMWIRTICLGEEWGNLFFSFLLCINHLWYMLWAELYSPSIFICWSSNAPTFKCDCNWTCGL
jgi:hypothetical protein